jgi:hypothetical protein
VQIVGGWEEETWVSSIQNFKLQLFELTELGKTGFPGPVLRVSFNVTRVTKDHILSNVDMGEVDSDSMDHRSLEQGCEALQGRLQME